MTRRDASGVATVPAAAERLLEPASIAEIRGTARLGKRTKALVRRLKPGDIAIIDHRDIDRMAAEDLVTAGVKRTRARS